MTPTLFYTVSRCRKEPDDRLYGPTHCTTDTDQTLCGLVIDERWWMGVYHYTPIAYTCKKCRMRADALLKVQI